MQNLLIDTKTIETSNFQTSSTKIIIKNIEKSKIFFFIIYLFIVGFVENANVSDFQFDNQHKTFISYGRFLFKILPLDKLTTLCFNICVKFRVLMLNLRIY